MMLLFAAAGFLFALWFGLFLRAMIDARLSLSAVPDSIAFVETSDGARLAIARYVPKNPRAGECPVVLCHGFGANRFNFDFDEQLSLARYLRSRGYDVFVLELRGTGLSTAKLAPSFDDLVARDIPAAIAHVLRETGAQKLNWIGHSLGGTVMYAALGGPLASKVNTLTALGAPAIFAPQTFLRRVSYLYPLARPILARMGTGLAKVAAAFAGSWVPGFSALANLRNMDSRVVRRVLWSMTAPNSVRMLDDFVRWLREGSGPTYAGMTQEQHWSGIHTPMLLIAGQADWCLAPAASVRHVYYHTASEDKEFVVLSKANGFKADYGHGDMVIGRHAVEEVFPLVERFLWAHRRPAMGSAQRVA